MVAPEVAACIDGITPALTTLLVCAIWLGITIPLFIALFYFSTPSLRKRPIFVANAAAISLGLLLGLLNVIIVAKSIQHPGQPMNRAAILFYTTFMGKCTSYSLYASNQLVRQ